MSSLVIVILIGILVQGCGSIVVKPEGGKALMMKVDDKIMWGIGTYQRYHFAYSDTSVTSITDVDDSTVITRCSYWMEPTEWRSAFLRKDGESRDFIWYTGSTVNVITRYNAEAQEWSHPDTLCLIGRRFDNRTGQFLDQQELLRIIDPDQEKNHDFRLSPDSSYMLVILYDDYKDAGEDEEVWNAELFVVSADMKQIQKTKVGIVVSEDYADDYKPELAVSNSGNVFYTFSRTQSDAVVQQSVVRLDMSQNRSDTLTAWFPGLYSPQEWEVYTLEPQIPSIQTLAGDTVLVAWPYCNGKNLMSVAVSKLDFRSKSFVFNDTLLFDDETREYLIDANMKNFRVSRCLTLPTGETLLVLEKTVNYNVSDMPMLPHIPSPPIPHVPFRMVTIPTAPVSSPVPSARVALPVPVAPPAPSTAVTETGSIVIVKIAANGAVQWQSSIMMDETTVVAGHYSSYHVTDSSFCILYRDGDAEDGITFSEFMLVDGRSRWWEMPVAFSGRSSWYSNYTLWLRDAIVLYGEDRSDYLCVQVTPSGKYTWFGQEKARRIVGGKRVEQ